MKASAAPEASSRRWRRLAARLRAAAPGLVVNFDNRPRVETQPGISAPFAQLFPQPRQAVPLPRRHRVVVETIDDRELQIAHPPSRLEREKRACVAQWNDVHARETTE